MKISRFCKIYKNKNSVLLFQTISLKKVILTLDEYEKMCESEWMDPVEISQVLYKMNMIIEKTSEDEELLMNARKRAENLNLRSIYLLITERCNLKCSYCFHKNCHFNCHKDMKIDTVKRSINALANESKENYIKEIYYTGGEPFLNKKTLYDSFAYVNDLVENGVLDNKFFQGAVTNGIPLDKSDIEKLVKYDVFVAISLDGFKLKHNLSRFSEEVNLKKILNTIDLLHDHQANYSVAATITEHNYMDLEEIAEYYSTKLNLKSFQFSLPLTNSYNNLSWYNPEEISNHLINAYEIARSHGVLEGRISIQAEAFYEEKLRYHDCISYSGEVIITPDNMISPAIYLMGSRSFAEIWNSNNFNIENRENFKYFARNTPFHIEKCLDCPALGICGGGSHYNRLMKNGTIEEIDDTFCIYCLNVLKWLINKMFEGEVD